MTICKFARLTPPVKENGLTETSDRFFLMRRQPHLTFSSISDMLLATSLIYHMNDFEQSTKEQALLSAAAEGNTEQVRQLLAQGAAVDCRNHCEKTPLIVAAQGGYTETVELLLRHGADVNAYDDWNTTPYLAACRAGNRDLIRRFLAEGADAYAESVEGDRALYYAAHHDSPELVDMLAPFSDLPGEESTGGGGSALAHACSEGNLRAVKRMLEWGISPNARGDCGNRSVLAYACSSGNLELVTYLLEQGADPSDEDYDGLQPICSALHADPFNPAVAELMLQLGNDINGGEGEYTPLAEARRYGTPEAVAWAIAHGARESDKKREYSHAYRTFRAAQSGLSSFLEWQERHRDEVDLQGALWMACSQHEVKAVACLLQAGADVNTRFEEEGHKTPLLCAYRDEIVELMLRYGAEVNICDDAGSTPLHHLLSMKWGGVAELLPRIRDEFIDGRDGEGMTPYLLACEYGQTEVARELVKRGADVSARNNQGETALHLAVKHAPIEMIKSLIEQGADVNATTHDGRTPLLCSRSLAEWQLLIAAGANVFHRSHCGWTLLMSAVASCKEGLIAAALKAGKLPKGHAWGAHVRRLLGCKLRSLRSPFLVKALAQAEALSYARDFYECSDFCVSSLTRACSRSDERAVAVLLEAGADVNARDKFTHRTPLFAACSPAGITLKPTLVERLLAAGADVNATDDCGQTPLHALSMLPDSPEKRAIYQLLLNAGAETGKIDAFGERSGDYQTSKSCGSQPRTE